MRAALAVAFRAYWKPLVSQALAIALVMLVVLPHIVFPLWGVAPGESKEMLTSLYQSTACFAAEHPNEVSDEERDAIDAVIGYDTLVERYNPRFANPVKDASNLEATAEESAAYLSAWLSQSLRHPSVYAEATLATAARFYSPGALL